jgi:hypothetical protein
MSFCDIICHILGLSVHFLGEHTIRLRYAKMSPEQIVQWAKSSVNVAFWLKYYEDTPLVDVVWETF